MRRFLTATFFLFLVAGTLGAKEVQNYTVKDGRIGSCLIKIVVPAEWNRNLLILAHGYRTEKSPLSADFEPKDVFPGELISKGWMVASTSYRRNGWIVDDAVSDIADLRAYVESTYGKPKHVYVFGWSMGGMIVTKMAEMKSSGYDGMVAVGAALWPEAPDPREKLSFSPRSYLLFMSNRNELDGPDNYLAQSARAPIPPALWHVERNGHCNVTGEESVAAFQALVRFHDTGKIARDKDGTIVPPVPRSVAVFRDGRAFAKVVQGGNVDTEFTAADLARLGIAQGSYLTLRFGERSARVLFGTTYGDVPNGEWVCFLKAEGKLRIARNFEDARATLGCRVGDTISIEPETPIRTGK